MSGYRLDGWQDIRSVGDWELSRRLEREYESLAYDLKVCGFGYPSPRKDVIRAIHAEQARRASREGLNAGITGYPGFDW